MSSFTFKQFHINQQHCAMKVGTDGILLGAWADVSDCQRILDMGTGTGLVAPQQAQENFKASPWHNRLHLTRQDVQTYCQQTAHQFDLIVANPPYFAQGVECKNDERALARYVQQSHLDWLNWASSCLSEKGKISFVLPYEAGKTLINSTALYCIKQTDVITKTGKDPQRILLTFSREHLPQVKDSLVIYNENNQYTEEFIALTKAFYLKM